MHRRILKKDRVWLIQWSWIQPRLFASLNQPPIAALYDSRLSDEKVAMAMQVIYDSGKTLLASDRVIRTYRNSVKKRQPYQDVELVHESANQLHVGYGDPYLFGQRVKDFCLDRLNPSNEIFYWTCPEHLLHRDREGNQLTTPYVNRPETRFKLEISYHEQGALYKMSTGENAVIPKKPPSIGSAEFLLTHD